MCNFISWLEVDGKGEEPRIKFLTTALIDKALEMGIDPIDLAGHEAIRRVYGLAWDEGKERECVDFSSPANFPAPIVTVLLTGRMVGFGPVPLGILSQPLDNEYWDKRKALWAEHRDKRKTLAAKYQATLKAFKYEGYAAKMTKIKALDDEYVSKRQLLEAERDSKLNPLDDEYWALVIDPACRAPAWRTEGGTR